MPRLTFETRNTRRNAGTTDAARSRAAPPAHPVVCPTCGEAEGFLLEMEGAVYRVLEDDHDTDLLSEAGDEPFVTCSACKTTMRAASVLASQEVDLAEDVLVPQVRPRIRMGPRRNRIHQAGTAGTRTTASGRVLPTCPECLATHDFFIDLEGAAYRVLEDDEDTDLLEGATNLLCSRCHAVFEL